MALGMRFDVHFLWFVVHVPTLIESNMQNILMLWIHFLTSWSFSTFQLFSSVRNSKSFIKIIKWMDCVVKLIKIWDDLVDRNHIHYEFDLKWLSMELKSKRNAWNMCYFERKYHMAAARITYSLFTAHDMPPEPLGLW